MSEPSREDNGERGGEEDACPQTGTNQGLFFKYTASGGRKFPLAKSLISLFKVNSLYKIIPSVTSCQDCVKKPEASAVEMSFTDIIFKMDFLIEKLSSLDLDLKREQGQAVKELYAGRDVLAVLPTGFSKS